VTGAKDESARTADVAYLRPIVARLGAREVHRIVDVIAAELEGGESRGDPTGR